MADHLEHRAIDALPVRSADEIRALLRPETRVVAIDEAQFFDSDVADLLRAARSEYAKLEKPLTEVEIGGWT